MGTMRHNIAYFGSIAVCLGIMAGASFAYTRHGGHGLVPDESQYIHVYRDTQANTSVNAGHDGCDTAGCYIAAQTSEDVYRSQRKDFGGWGWVPSGEDLYMRHPLVTTQEAYPQHYGHYGHYGQYEQPRHHHHAARVVHEHYRTYYR